MRTNAARVELHAAVIALAVLGCGSTAGAGGATAPPRAPVGQIEDGRASYYARTFNGRKTASGERYDPRLLTAAHRSLPFGTWIRVTRQGGASVVVRVNDRCGGIGGRILDLSGAAARKLDMLRVGVVPVRLEVIGGP